MMGFNSPLSRMQAVGYEKLIEGGKLERTVPRPGDVTWRDVIKRMSAEEAVEHLKWLLDEITWAPENGLNPVPGVHLTAQEAKALHFLDKSRGRVVSINALLVASSDRHADADLPCDKLVGVIICKLRKKLRGTGVRIETHRAAGYSLHLEPGATLNWNKAA